MSLCKGFTRNFQRFKTSQYSSESVFCLCIILTSIEFVFSTKTINLMLISLNIVKIVKALCLATIVLLNCFFQNRLYEIINYR